jgi:glucan phosphorylase
MEQVITSIALNRVPAYWNTLAYPSKRGLSSWLANLFQRIEQLNTVKKKKKKKKKNFLKRKKKYIFLSLKKSKKKIIFFLLEIIRNHIFFMKVRRIFKF